MEEIEGGERLRTIINVKPEDRFSQRLKTRGMKAACSFLLLLVSFSLDLPCSQG